MQSGLHGGLQGNTVQALGADFLVRIGWKVWKQSYKEKPTETKIKDADYYGGGHASPYSLLSVLALITWQGLAKALM